VTSEIILKLSFLVIVVATMSACQEEFETHYPSAADAAKAGEFDRGWLPELLKPDAADIREWHDIDSNEVRGKFAMNARIHGILESSCSSAKDLPRKTWFMPSWFPSSIYRGDAAAHDIQIFRCNNFFVAEDKTAAVGYFWDTAYPRN